MAKIVSKGTITIEFSQEEWLALRKLIGVTSRGDRKQLLMKDGTIPESEAVCMALLVSKIYQDTDKAYESV